MNQVIAVNTPVNPPSAPPAQSAGHRWIIAISTGVAIGGMLSSLSLIEVGPGGKLLFRWHWAAVPLMGAGIAVGLWFWRRVFRSAAEDPASGGRHLRRAGLLLIPFALIGFLYPLRFVESERRKEVLVGLILALLALSLMAFLIWKVIRWVNEHEPKEGETE